MPFVSIDFETANEKRSSPCAIGIAVVDGIEIVAEYYSLINPSTHFSSFNTRIHGIRAGDVADAPTFAELWPTLDSYLSNHLAVAHNASFVMSVIRHSLDQFNLTYPEMDYLCTANISRRVWPDLANHKLNTVASYHGIRFDHHRALEDARVAAKILIEAFRTYETDELDIFLRKCHMSKGRIYERGYVPPKARQSTKIYY